MKTIQSSIILAAGIAVGLTLFTFIGEHVRAQEEDLTIGIVNRKEVLDNYDLQVARSEELEAQRAAMQEELQEVADRVQQLEEELEGLDETETARRREITTQMEEDIRWLASERQRREGVLNSRANNILRDLLRDVDKAINTVAAQNGYTIVLDGNLEPDNRNSVLYYEGRVDFTTEVIAYINSDDFESTVP